MFNDFFGGFRGDLLQAGVIHALQNPSTAATLSLCCILDSASTALQIIIKRRRTFSSHPQL